MHVTPLKIKIPLRNDPSAGGISVYRQAFTKAVKMAAE